MSPRAPRQPRPRRRRGAAESLGAIVLVFESVVVFLGGLAVYGLKTLPDGIPSWWGVAAGTFLAVVMVLTTRFTGTRAGIVVGWVLQAIVLAAGLLVPALVIVGLLFGGLWAYATIKGASLDRRTRGAGEPDVDPANGEPT